MTAKPYNPPAFPVLGEGEHAGFVKAAPGMSLRDWFAGQAMQGMLANHERTGDFVKRRTLAEESYFWADAMLAERTKTDD